MEYCMFSGFRGVLERTMVYWGLTAFMSGPDTASF